MTVEDRKGKYRRLYGCLKKKKTFSLNIEKIQFSQVIKNLIKTIGAQMYISYNKYEKTEVLILDENRHQAISQVEAINSIAVQLALLRTENKVGSTHDTK